VRSSLQWLSTPRPFNVTNVRRIWIRQSRSYHNLRGTVRGSIHRRDCPKIDVLHVALEVLEMDDLSRRFLVHGYDSACPKVEAVTAVPELVLVAHFHDVVTF
jgi:hypothetical protein